MTNKPTMDNNEKPKQGDPMPGTNLMPNEKPVTPNVEVNAVEMVDIYDKVQKYIVIKSGKVKCIINVGQKTFDAVKEMTK